jgi:hypothetical protein
MNDKSLREIEDLLPNGFHDARLIGFSVCLATNEAKFDLQIFVGDPDADVAEEKEKYRNSTLLLQDLCYFVVDPPTDGVNYSPQSSRIDGGVADEASPEALRPRKSTPDGAFAYWFYVEGWNSFIHIAAKVASLQWV